MEGIANLRDFTAQNSAERIIVNMLEEDVPLFKNAQSMPANDGMTHKTALITSLPTAETKIINAGVGASKPTLKEAVFDVAQFQTRVQFDSDVENVGVLTQKFKMANAAAAVEALGQAAEEALFYGDGAVGSIYGIQHYYNAISGGATAKNIISCGGSTSNKQTSIYLIGMGERAFHLIHAQNAPAGIVRKDLGIQTQTLSNGKQIDWKIEKWNLNIGSALVDWRTCGRLCNIELGGPLDGSSNPTYRNLYAEDSNGAAKVVNAIATRATVLLNRLKGNYGKLGFYCTPDVISLLANQAYNKANGALGFTQDEAGHQRVTLWGVPLYKSDAILTTEAVVS